MRVLAAVLAGVLVLIAGWRLVATGRRGAVSGRWFLMLIISVFVLAVATIW